MTRWSFVIGLGLALIGSAAQAQYAPYPGQPYYSTPPNAGPGLQAGQGTPLSPYLNLRAGNGGFGTNAATNYYNFVRPAQQAQRAATLGAIGTTGGGPRQVYFPPGNLDELGDADAAERAKDRFGPTGHPVGFNNTFGYFPGGGGGGMGGQRMMGQPQRQGQNFFSSGGANAARPTRR